MTFRPRYVTLDCYCTLTNFDMTGAAHLGIGDTEIGASLVRGSCAFQECCGARKDNT